MQVLFRNLHLGSSSSSSPFHLSLHLRLLFPFHLHSFPSSLHCIFIHRVFFSRCSSLSSSPIIVVFISDNCRLRSLSPFHHHLRLRLRFIIIFVSVSSSSSSPFHHRLHLRLIIVFISVSSSSSCPFHHRLLFRSSSFSSLIVSISSSTMI